MPTPPVPNHPGAFAAVEAIAAAAAGVRPSALRWLTSGTCAVATDGDVVVRVAPDRAGTRGCAAAAAVLATAGLAVPPIGGPVMVSGYAVTTWPYVAALRPATWSDVADLLAALHTLAPPADFAAAVGRFTPWPAGTQREYATYLGSARAQPATAAVMSAAQSALAHLPTPAGPLVLIHRDARPQNVLVGPAGPRFIDMDMLLLGPAVVDLVIAVRRAGIDPADAQDDPCDLDAFAAAYGSEPADHARDGRPAGRPGRRSARRAGSPVADGPGPGRRGGQAHHTGDPAP